MESGSGIYGLLYANWRGTFCEYRPNKNYPGDRPKVELPTPIPPNQGYGVHATLCSSPSPTLTDTYYLLIKPYGKNCDDDSIDARGCIAYYDTGATDASTAYDGIDSYWPAINEMGDPAVDALSIVCVKETSPPPPNAPPRSAA